MPLVKNPLRELLMRAESTKKKKKNCSMLDRIEALEELVDALILFEVGWRDEKDHNFFLDSQDLIHKTGRNIKLRKVNEG